MTPLTWAFASFSVKYMWPVFHRRQFDSSPSTQTSTNRSSSRTRIRPVSSETLRTRRAAGAGGGPVPGGSGSGSSNGWSKRDVIQLGFRITDPRDPLRASGLVVRFDDDAVEPRVAGRRLEPRGHPVEE